MPANAASSSLTKFVVHSTWNESRNDEFPQVLEYRRKWQQLGFPVVVTPNQDIRNDIQTLDTLEPSLSLLQKFDNLATTNMKFDVWRYTKLYLEGGMYADVDVEPLEGVVRYTALADSSHRPIIFEESNWPSNVVTRFLIPKLSDYDHLPAYGTCLVISPTTPRNDFFLQLLREMHPDEWLNVKEPKRTLMSVGPGHVTRFVQTHVSDAILVGYRERSSVYIHHGFGTWKSWAPKEIVLASRSIVGVVLLLLVWKSNKRWKRQKKEPTSVKHADDDMEAAPLIDGQQLRKRHNHSPETVYDV